MHLGEPLGTAGGLEVGVHPEGVPPVLFCNFVFILLWECEVRVWGGVTHHAIAQSCVYIGR
jgi:hypothetical protein